MQNREEKTKIKDESLPKESSRKQKHYDWHSADNTAALYPIITSDTINLTNVYRMSLLFWENIKPDILQQALEEILPYFKAFNTRMHKGFFWYYLEENPLKPQVLPETQYPCSFFNMKEHNNYLFQITYYKNRVNLEVYHVIADGFPALDFLSSVVCRYLALLYPQDFSKQDAQKVWCAEHADNLEDSYIKYYRMSKKEKRGSYGIGRGYMIREKVLPYRELSVTHANLKLDQVLAVCHRKNVTVSHYITACILWAIYAGILDKQAPKYPVNIFIPINLRNLFPSDTSLNFYSSFYATYDFKNKDVTFDDVLQSIKEQYLTKVNKKDILAKLTFSVGQGYSPFIRCVPLPIKNIGLRVIFENGNKSVSARYSNLGKFELPEPFTKYVGKCQSMLGPSPTEPFKCGTVSYGNNFVLTMGNSLRHKKIEREMIRQLVQDGLDVKIETNGV